MQQTESGILVPEGTLPETAVEAPSEPPKRDPRESPYFRYYDLRRHNADGSLDEEETLKAQDAAFLRWLKRQAKKYAGPAPEQTEQKHNRAYRRQQARLATKGSHA